MTSNTDTQQGTTRRGFLDWLIALGSGITLLAMAIPGLAYLWPAARGGGAKSVEVKDANKLKPNESETIPVGSQGVIVVRGRSGFKAFSASCTHLGCLVKWDPASKKFRCPCHAGVFNLNGEVVSGPAPAPLPEFKVKQVGDKVVVSSA